MKKSLILILSFLAFALASCGSFETTIENPNVDLCFESNTTPGVFICEKVFTGYFDTTISLKLYYEEDDTYNITQVFDNVTSTISTYNMYLDKYSEYDGITNIYTINENQGADNLNDELYLAIQYGLENSNLVVKDDVALFNMALHPVLEVWHNARNSSECDGLTVLYCPLPNDEIDGVDFNTDINDVILDIETSSVHFLEPNMGLDLGGYAKGYLANILQAYLNDIVSDYLLNLGNSNIITGGQNPTRESGLYYIALEKPVTDFVLQTEYYQYIKISEGLAVVTSGVNQRYFKELGTEDVYHHIIDPRTNYPGGEVMSVTIIYPDSAIADILSTSVFLLDLDSAKTFVNSYDDLEAVWYLDDGTIEYSDNFYDLYNYDVN